VESAEVTGLLKAWGTGAQAALERLASVVYEELRRVLLDATRAPRVRDFFC
jgi:hypothetical protein